MILGSAADGLNQHLVLTLEIQQNYLQNCVKDHDIASGSSFAW